MGHDLFRKYDIPAPRYTSYPTVPYWGEVPTLDRWIESLTKTLQEPLSKWSLYLHIPFCETLCTFCGCNTTITKNHKLEHPYTERLIKERNAYLAKVPALRERILSQVHLGGGTPTFLSESNLETLMKGIFEGLQRDSHFEGSIEVDPRRTRKTQLELLAKYGFNRVSLGVQDFDPEVQRLIHREQSYQQTELITTAARDLGYVSVNFDLIYGLPKQTLDTIVPMIEKTAKLRPDRIALYSFALVPWIKPSQRLFKDEDLPRGEEKRALYEKAREMLLAEGYVEIGMDHFALPTDALAKSSTEQSLHRNFMGYTDQRTEVLLGLGVSAISETPEMFFQNEKVLPKFETMIDADGFAPFRGHHLTAEDRHARRQILELMTRGRTSLLLDPEKDVIMERLEEMIKDGLVEVSAADVRLLPKGKPFLRNLCLAFDRRFYSAQPQTRVFSQVL